MLEKGKRRND
jgi:hypothetical protein